jgi:hypothetical protein
MGEVRLRDEQDPTGVLVETMHDTGAEFSADSRERAGACEKSVYECARLLSLGRMHGESCWLVEDEEVLVFEKNLELHFFGHEIECFGLGKKNLEVCTGGSLAACGGGGSVDVDVALINQPLELGACRLTELRPVGYKASVARA